VRSPQQHHSEKAARRCLRTYRYSAVRCSQHNKKLAGGGRATCPKGDACGFAHTVYELWLHADRFRTQMCLHGAAWWVERGGLLGPRVCPVALPRSGCLLVCRA
jgi:hypothetical protein